MVLLEGIKGGKEELKVEDPIFLNINQKIGDK
jgi:tRNA1(Val) A37 N6-methylase TrmN6